MRIDILYGVGGWCKDCDPTHDHPLNNIIEAKEMPDEDESSETSVEP
jgi:hypothetical protein